MPKSIVELTSACLNRKCFAMDTETAGKFFTCPKLLEAWSLLKLTVDEMYKSPIVATSGFTLFTRLDRRVEIEKQMGCLIETQRIYDQLGLK